MDAASLIGKPVISLYEGNTVGRVRALKFATGLKRLESIILDHSKGYIKAKDMLRFRGDAVVIKNTQLLQTDGIVPLMPLNADVFNTEGTYLGKILSVQIEEKQFSVTEIPLSEGGVLPIDRLLSVRNELVLVKKQGQSLPPLKPKNKKDFTRTSAIISRKRYITNYEFLAGRVAEKNILSRKGTVVVRKGEVLTNELIKKTITEGRIMELLKCSKVR